MIVSFNLTPPKVRNRLFEDIYGRLYEIGVKFNVEPKEGRINLERLIPTDSITGKESFMHDLFHMVEGIVRANQSIKEFTDSVSQGKA